VAKQIPLKLLLKILFDSRTPPKNKVKHKIMLQYAAEVSLLEGK
jgi:hypothetical protein